MYVSSSSYMYLCIPCYCDACLKSSALRVGVKTLHTKHKNYLAFYLISVKVCPSYVSRPLKILSFVVPTLVLHLP